VVAEGEFEPRSIGSYSLRVYSGVPAEFPTDRFLTGIIRPRNGMLESVKFADLDGDGHAEIIVAVRSVGSGGYLSADAFRFEGTSLQLLASVSGLDKHADPVDALRNKVERPH
jgi:Periplasmic lysozyme inhibitor of I-type lysozyme